MKKVDIKQKTMAFNECRQKNLKKSFFIDEIRKELKEVGIPVAIFDHLNKHNVFDKQIVEGRTLYSFKDEPVHTSFMEKIYGEKRDQVRGYRKSVGQKPEKSLISQQQAWDTLVEAGIIKTKFNLNTLKTKYPKVYLDCLEYELNPGK